MKIIKSSGIAQDFDPQKIINVLTWATENTSIDPYVLFEDVKTQIQDGMTTAQIQEMLIKFSANMITEVEPDYQFVAANLQQFALRKKVYSRFTPIDLYTHINRCISKGVYDDEIVEKFSKEEIDALDKKIDHNRDFTYSYAGSSQLIEKYLVQDRSTGTVFETPQMALMLIGMCLHQEEKENRLKYIEEFYNAASLQQISLPTPIMAGVRTPTRQFSSCVVIDADDSLDGINEASAAIVKYVSRRAGIGLNAGMIRAEGSKVRSGEVKHTGVIPFWKHFQTAVGSSSQGGVRKGSATVNWPIWHLEFENLIVLKNNKGTEESRIRHMDYCVQINNLMMERLLNNDYITLFSPDVAGGDLYAAYFSNEELFKEIYERLEKDPDVRKKRIKAVDVFQQILNERSNTARIYLSFVDNVNRYGPFDRKIDPVRMTNLCCEISLPTRPLASETPLINLCTLSAFVLDKFNYQDQAEVERIAMVMVRALDNLLDYQDYPVKEAKPSKAYRSLGVGVTNFAGFLANQMLSYADAKEVTHELFERLMYALLKASNTLAKERGAAFAFDRTKYSWGVMPIDEYNKNIDKLIAPKYVCDWDSLRCSIKDHGLRNCTLMALMPCETSSQVSNSTAGIEKIRSGIVVKQSKSGTYNQVAHKFADNQLFYDYAWDIKPNGNKDYLALTCIMQKFVDQAISVNTYYNPFVYRTNKVPMSEIFDDVIFTWYHGGKNMYYHNTKDGSGEDDAGCESCKL